MRKLLLPLSVVLILTTSFSLFNKKYKCKTEPLYREGTIVVFKDKDTVDVVFIHKVWRNEYLHLDRPFCQWNYTVSRIPKVKRSWVKYWMDGTKKVINTEYTDTWEFWIFEDEIIMELFDFN